MHADDFKLLLTQLVQLSHRQRDKLGRTLNQTTAQEQVVALIDAAKTAHRVARIASQRAVIGTAALTRCSVFAAPFAAKRSMV